MTALSLLPTLQAAGGAGSRPADSDDGSSSGSADVNSTAFADLLAADVGAAHPTATGDAPIAGAGAHARSRHSPGGSAGPDDPGAGEAAALSLASVLGNPNPPAAPGEVGRFGASAVTTGPTAVSTQPSSGGNAAARPIDGNPPRPLDPVTAMPAASSGPNAGAEAAASQAFSSVASDPLPTENDIRGAATESRPQSRITIADGSARDIVAVAGGDELPTMRSSQDSSGGAKSSGTTALPVGTNIADALGHGSIRGRSTGGSTSDGGGKGSGDLGKDSDHAAKPLHGLDRSGGAGDFATTASSFGSAQPTTVTTPTPTPTHVNAPQHPSEIRYVPQNAQSQPLHRQVSGGILELQARGDGTHRMLLELHPADLGRVTVEVRMHAGALTINLGSVNDAARHSIQQALPQLRAELADVGLSNASISVGADASGNSSHQRSDRTTQSPLPREGAAEQRLALQQLPTSSVRSSTHTGVDRWL